MNASPPYPPSPTVLLVGACGTPALDARLAGHGMRTERRVLGIEALERLFEPDTVLPRVAVLGELTPDFDALTLLRTLRAAPATLHLPLILLVDSVAEHVARQAGATVCLPRRANDAMLADAVCRCIELEAGQPAPARGRTAPRRRVLVVDDEPVNRAAASDMLRRLSLDADTAHDGHHALERLAATAYTLVLLDLHMPVLDGFDVARRLRTGGGASAGASVFALTADTREGVAEQCMLSGMDGFLPKPITFAMLRETLASVGIDTPAPASAVSDLDLTALFYASAREHVEALEASLSADERVRFRQTAHALKGSALQFGAQDVAAIAARLEAEAELAAEALTDSVASIRSLLADAQEQRPRSA